MGQTSDFRARLVKHDKEKEFWERALSVISRTDIALATRRKVSRLLSRIVRALWPETWTVFVPMAAVKSSWYAAIAGVGGP